MSEPTRQFQSYRHYKGGLYVKMCEALHTETDELMVIYTSAATGQIFCRSKAMFEDSVTTETYTGPRFTPLPHTH